MLGPNKGVAWVYSREEDEALDDAFFSGIFKTAFENRRALLHSDDTTTFRLFNGEGDGFGGVTIDWYDGFIVVSWYSEGVYHYRDLILRRHLLRLKVSKGSTKRFVSRMKRTCQKANLSVE